MPENQVQMPKLNRVRAITANGSAGNQAGMSCISKALPRLEPCQCEVPGNRRQ